MDENTARTHWELCILCQTSTEEKLVCPLANPIQSRRDECYSQLFNLYNKFKDANALPHSKLVLPSVEALAQNSASWHRSCRIKYTETYLEKSKKLVEVIY